ncbi:oxygenase MpaB family protein [Lipingzhangella sp. LS1_29]|uniref:Oxygenase MpaB family protein n=1 Tax=Lipingzhangella rawalii TaxID=2055835 RepID=A0ABU2H1U2_9ACTN|nr:oxygenase MpaB family protein [Lipingzhangella rawalii]MDS1269257.1 oxygenase MpaB family protein [Lipingzhangella rawalii]
MGASAGLTVSAPESVTWAVHLDRAMWVAGVRALMLQALHPVAMQGVWQRSDFMRDPTGRLLRTADFVAVTTYGTPAEADEVGRRVRAVHRSISFTDPETGKGHRADDPELLLWVHCAEVTSYLEIVTRSGLRISEAGADAYFAEQQRTATYVGLEPRDVPGSTAQMRRYLAEMRPRLRVTEEARAATRFLMWPRVPQRLAWLAPMKPLWLPIGALAYYSLPRWARDAYGILPEFPGVEAATSAGLGAVRATLHLTPNVLYNQLFDEITVLRAKAARERLEEVGYDFGPRLVRTGRIRRG